MSQPSTPSLHGMGVVTDTTADIITLMHDLLPDAAQLSPAWQIARARTRTLDATAVASHDILAQLALRAAHQALSMAGDLDASSKIRNPDSAALLFVSTWGNIDATVAYLDSMLEADGRYTSPRHFSRSVYASAASLTAIHFNIHGPCETLCFPASPVGEAITSAARLLAAGRADRVLVIWADQSAPIAQDLALRAAGQLHRAEYRRYADGHPGYGAVAMLLTAAPDSLIDLAAQKPFPHPGEHCQGIGGPSPVDGALALVENIIKHVSSTPGPGPILQPAINS